MTLDLSLDDYRLTAACAAAVGVPRAEVIGDRFSFVLHAPLELLARAALLPFVEPSGRDAARQRIDLLATGYESSGPPVPEPVVRDGEFASREQAAARLADAIDAEDLDDADRAATWFGQRARADQVASLLAGAAIDRLSAAGHGNIYFALLARNQPRGLPTQMLRHPVRALASGSHHRIHVPPTRPGGDGSALLQRLATVEDIERPASFFIAPMVEHAQSNGVFDVLLDGDGRFAVPAATPFELQRFAAQTMLQGPTEQAPYGWTHCLTLAQAPLLLAASGAPPDPGAAIFVAAAYLAAHWATQGKGRVDLDYEPGRPSVPDVRDALLAGPAEAAAAAWHATDSTTVVSALATAASAGEDAHRVKYTLACLDAASTDQSYQRLYLAAAASLNAWWEVRQPRPVEPVGNPGRQQD